ncbi:hypothetical protein DFH06DRAFT_978817 [Mycena polygramma]|nr:hypothetical protein DFH06DRAFT_978817 [Mycena polygramma]
MNADIRSNPNLDSPYFDLAGHLGSRAYCLHNVVYAEGHDETAALLDIGVKDLLPPLMPAPRVPSPKDTFAIRRTEGNTGFGMVATQNISAGGLIVVERPILVAPYIIALQSHPESDFYNALLRRLSPETAARFLALANCKPASECDMVEGIMRTNAIAITLDVPDMPHPELPTHRAIFPNISRCNHSCGPNSKWLWDADSFSLSLVALRPIQVGEEVTVAYINPTYSCAERRAKLHAMYGFTCNCPFCTLSPAALALSDAARCELRFASLSSPSSSPYSSPSSSPYSSPSSSPYFSPLPSHPLPTFEAWCRDPRLPAHLLIDTHKRAVALIEAEGLEMLDRTYGKHLDALAMGYGALRDVEQFRLWARKARDCRPMDADATWVLQKWIKCPETFPVWGWRVDSGATRR